MRVSVIIPTYNRRRFVINAILSVMRQKEAVDEMIIVDDGSTDDTGDISQKFTEKITYYSQTNEGVSAARNLGIQKAKHDWLAFLDSDDMWKPKKLFQQKKALLENPQYRLCYTNEEWRYNGKWKNPKKIHQKYSGWIYDKCLPLCIISSSSVIIHKSVFDEVGLFDENLPACEDYDLWLRITHRFPVLLMKEKLIIKQSGNWEQLSLNHSLDKYRIIALAKMLETKTLQPENRQKTYDVLNLKCNIYKTGCLKHDNLSEARWAEQLLKQYKIQEPDE